MSKVDLEKVEEHLDTGSIAVFAETLSISKKLNRSIMSCGREELSEIMSSLIAAGDQDTANRIAISITLATLFSDAVELMEEVKTQRSLDELLSKKAGE